MTNNMTVRTESNFPQVFRAANKRFTATIYINGEEYSSTASTRDNAISAAITAAEFLGGYNLHLAEPTSYKSRHPLVEDLDSLKNAAVGIPVFLAKAVWKWLRETEKSKRARTITE